MHFSVIVVHFNAPQQLQNCLGSIPHNVEVIVVDNASTDDPKQELANAHPGTIWLRNEHNIGYGAAMNQGVNASTKKQILLLNQDIILAANAMEELAQDIGTNGEYGIWGAQLQSENGKAQGVAGPFPSLFAWLVRFLLPRSKRKYYRKKPEPCTPVDWITGAFMSMPRATFEKLQGFDDEFFMYYEDTDLCKRAAERNIGVSISKAKATHSTPMAERTSIPVTLAQSIRYSQLHYFKKHRPNWEYHSLLMITRIYFAIKQWGWRTE